MFATKHLSLDKQLYNHTQIHRHRLKGTIVAYISQENSLVFIIRYSSVLLILLQYVKLGNHVYLPWEHFLKVYFRFWVNKSENKIKRKG